MRRLLRRFDRIVLVAAALALGGGCFSARKSATTSDAGSDDVAAGDAGAAAGSGGANGGTGGAVGSGGAVGTGGAIVGTGGAIVGSGGAVGSGGTTVGTGSAVGSGGTIVGTGGAVGSGGMTGAPLIGFSTTLSCNGSTLVFLGVRPPQTAGSDVICWTSGVTPPAPIGDQLWVYDPGTRMLVNQINQLALKRRANSTLEAGTSATDGSPLTSIPNADGTYSLVFDDGNVIGIGIGNCPGALYSVVPPGTTNFRTTFTLHP